MFFEKCPELLAVELRNMSQKRGFLRIAHKAFYPSPACIICLLIVRPVSIVKLSYRKKIGSARL
jgi:hypothetical protein